MTGANEGRDRFEPFVDLLSFSNRAAAWFLQGDNQSKRLILETVGSNLSLKAKTLSVAAKKPFAALAKSNSCPYQLGVVDDVRTSRRKVARLTLKVWRDTQDDDGQRILRIK